MEATKNLIPAEITLTSTGGTVTVNVNGETIATVKDGARLIQRTDAHLVAAHIHRATGYTAQAGVLVAGGRRAA